MHLNEIFDPLFIEDIVDKGPMSFLVKQSGQKADISKNQNIPMIPKLARQDSVDDFLAGQRVLPEAIHQFMAENVFDNQRMCNNASEGDGSANQAQPVAQQPNQLPPIMPKLKRQDSVDDFLADDRARSRSLTDFINLHEDEKSSTKRPKVDLTSDSLPAAIQTQSPEPTSHRPTEPSPPPQADQTGATAKSSARRRRRETTPSAGNSNSSEEGREGRRREQNREAQRRFRERRKYLEFQAFSQRLAAAAAAAAAAQPPAYYPPAALPPTYFPAHPPRPMGGFPPGFFGIM
jgi:hypothetical protein